MSEQSFKAILDIVTAQHQHQRKVNATILDLLIGIGEALEALEPLAAEAQTRREAARKSAEINGTLTDWERQMAGDN